jgi:hypothetical protein
MLGGIRENSHRLDALLEPSLLRRAVEQTETSRPQAGKAENAIDKRCGESHQPADVVRHGQHCINRDRLAVRRRVCSRPALSIYPPVTFMPRLIERREPARVWVASSEISASDARRHHHSTVEQIQGNEQRASAEMRQERITASGAAIFPWLAPPVRALAKRACPLRRRCSVAPKDCVSSVSGRQREATGSAQGKSGGCYDLRYEAATADMSAR